MTRIRPSEKKPYMKSSNAGAGSGKEDTLIVYDTETPSTFVDEYILEVLAPSTEYQRQDSGRRLGSQDLCRVSSVSPRGS